MIPRGAIYGELRSQMLRHFPDGSKALFGNSDTFGDWLSKGALVVKKSEKKGVLFEAPKSEFGGILLTEVENLLNHCFEHLQELGCVSQDTRIRSEAWITVTAYYFAFFSASALLRLIGRPVVFLLREQLASLCKMSGTGVAATQGTYEVLLGSSVSATHAEFRLKQTSKVHEATWLNLLGLFDQLRRKGLPDADGMEVLFYESLCTTALFSQYLNFQWPSSVRNRANYRPGFAYKLQTARSRHCNAITDWEKIETQEAIRIVAGAANSCASDSENFGKHVHLLISTGVSLFMLTRELYSDLLTRRSLDKRWEQSRRAYRKKMIFPENEYKILTRTF